MRIFLSKSCFAKFIEYEKLCNDDSDRNGSGARSVDICEPVETSSPFIGGVFMVGRAPTFGESSLDLRLLRSLRKYLGISEKPFFYRIAFYCKNLLVNRFAEKIFCIFVVFC